MPIKDLEKRRLSWRNWYHRNKHDQSKKIYFNREKRKARFRGFIRELKATLACSRCGYNRHPAALDFHHRDRKLKKFCIASMVKTCQSIERLKQELEKCDVICSNCHRVEHFGD